jgi:hypothetical protein
MVSNISICKSLGNIYGISKESPLHINQIANIKLFGKLNVNCFYSDSFHLNILSFALLRNNKAIKMYYCYQNDKFYITINSTKTTYTFNNINNIYVFQNTINGDNQNIYTNTQEGDIILNQSTNNNNLNCHHSLITTNTNNQENNKLNIITNLHLTLSHISYDRMKILIKNKSLLLPKSYHILTVQDLKNHKHLIQSCTSCLAGKATRIPLSLSIDMLNNAIPGEIYHIDVFQVTGITNEYYILGVEESTGYCILKAISTKDGPSILQAISEFQDHMKICNTSIKNIITDNDRTLESVRTQLSSMGISLHQFGPEQHEKTSERMVRTIKERVRCCLKDLNYNLPVTHMKHLLYYIIQSLNSSPNSKVPNDTPRYIIERNLMSDTSYVLPYGHISLFKKPNVVSDTEPRAEYCIVLGRNITSNTFKVLHLDTLKEVTRDQIYHVEPTDEQIKTIKMKIETHYQCLNNNTYTTLPNINYKTTTNTNAAEASINDSTSTTNDTTNNTQPNPPTEQVIEIGNLDEDEYAVDKVLAWRFKKTRNNKNKTKEYFIKWKNHSDDENTWEPRSNLTKIDKDIIDDVLHYNDYMNTIPKYNCSYSFSKSVCLSATTDNSVPSENDQIKQAHIDELNSLFNLNTFTPISPDTINDYINKRTVNSFFLIKKKVNSHGEFVKWKSRFCCNGKNQSNYTFNSNSITSPTIRSSSLKTLLSIAAHDDLEIATLDVKSAFLHSNIDTDIFVRVNKRDAHTFLEYDKSLSKYITQHGNIYLQLQKSLYGIAQAPQLFFNHISSSLISFGCKQSSLDKCVFKYTNPTNPSEFIIVGIHVDDLVLTSTSSSLIHNIIQHLTNIYKEITCEYKEKNPNDFQFDYLGLSVKRNRANRYIELSQAGLIDGLLSKYSITGTSVIPSDKNLLKAHDKTPPDLKQLALHNIYDNKTFLSIIMSINFLTYTRPDLLFTTSFLCTRSSNPSKHDWVKLFKLLRYINCTKNMYMKLQPSDLIIKCQTDASDAVHSDSRSQSGVLVYFGSMQHEKAAVVYAKSNKQALTTKSSCESELVSIQDGIDEVIFLRQLLNELGYTQSSPTPIFQDNLSTIHLAENGNGSYTRTKHINRKYFYVTDKINDKQITMKHLPTHEMSADILTKAVLGKLFRTHVNRIMNTQPPNGENSD